jgi:nickel-dependent lactate racemase
VRYLEDCGIGRERMTILIASGLHRKMTDEEIRERFTASVADSVRVVNHDAFDEGAFTLIGEDATAFP